VAHGLTKFVAQDLIKSATSAKQLLEEVTTGAPDRNHADALQEAVQVALENQIKIAETLDLIKTEFDKFEDGLSRIM
jgi:hypothetical protein